MTFLCAFIFTAEPQWGIFKEVFVYTPHRRKVVLAESRRETMRIPLPFATVISATDVLTPVKTGNVNVPTCYSGEKSYFECIFRRYHHLLFQSTTLVYRYTLTEVWNSFHLSWYLIISTKCILTKNKVFLGAYLHSTNPFVWNDSISRIPLYI